jgi:hypothetical protein
MTPPLDLNAVREWALALPETEEVTHFRLPAFKVRGKLFAGPCKDGTVIVSLAQPDAAAVAAEDSETFEEVWRSGGPNGRIFVGLRVDLGRVERERLGALIEQAWRHRAPRRLVAAHDARGVRSRACQEPT